MNKVRRRLEPIERESEALSRLGTIRAYHIERRRAAKRDGPCHEAIARFDVFDAAMAKLPNAST